MEIAEIITLIICFILGAMLGSFACCQAWRLRLKQLKKQDPGKWSVCLSCGKRLKASENIPILSWLVQRGRCKHCGAHIGKAEFLSELSLGLSLAALGAFFYPEVKNAFRLGFSSSTPMLFPTPLMLCLIILMLIISMTVMWILLIYDAKWQELPVKLLTILNACAIIITILHFVGLAFNFQSISDLVPPLLNTLGAAAILGGTYFCLYFFSKERLVGSGDWLVALPIALILGNWWLALITLFLANMLGSIVGIFLKFKKGFRQIPFGPFLILAFVVVYVMQPWLLSLVAGL